MNTKVIICHTIDDMVSDFLYYDRKEDEQLPNGAIESAIENGVITVDEISDRFKQRLLELL